MGKQEGINIQLHLRLINFIKYQLSQFYLLIFCEFFPIFHLRIQQYKPQTQYFRAIIFSCFYIYLNVQNIKETETSRYAIQYKKALLFVEAYNILLFQWMLTTIKALIITFVLIPCIVICQNDNQTLSPDPISTKDVDDTPLQNNLLSQVQIFREQVQNQQQKAQNQQSSDDLPQNLLKEQQKTIPNIRTAGQTQLNQDNKDNTEDTQDDNEDDTGQNQNQPPQKITLNDIINTASNVIQNLNNKGDISELFNGNNLNSLINNGQLWSKIINNEGERAATNEQHNQDQEYQEQLGNDETNSNQQDQEQSEQSSKLLSDRVYMLQQTNLLRQENGANNLVFGGATLTKIAQQHSQDMVQRGFFNHVNPDGESPGDRARRNGYSQFIGENIAIASGGVEQCQKSFVNSPPHFSNAINRQWKSVGVGIAYKPGGSWQTTYVTMVFSPLNS